MIAWVIYKYHYTNYLNGFYFGISRVVRSFFNAVEIVKICL